MCQFELKFSDFKEKFGADFEKDFLAELNQLEGLKSDGLLTQDSKGLKVTELGRLFVRNIAMVFDAYLKQSAVTFSKTV